LNGEVVPADMAKVSVYDHGLLYGVGIFEGLRFYNQKIFRLPKHLARLQDSAKAIALELPYELEYLQQVLNHLVSRYNEPNGYIRLVITRGVGSLGLNPYQCERATVFIILDECVVCDPGLLKTGIKLHISSIRRLAADGLDPKIKSLNYLNQIMAKIEAVSAHADEAVLLNQLGFVAEGTAENLFIFKDERLMTPCLADGALDGITRRSIIELAVGQGIEVKETSISSYDLYTADACFLTGSGAEIVPVASIGGRELSQSAMPMLLGLQEAFHALVQQETRDLAA